MAIDLYRMAGPTEWATAPDVFSYSALVGIETCPRRWQLEHSRYGSLESFPARPVPAAVEGQIVHGVLEQLFKALALRGLPPLASTEFRSCMEQFDMAGTVLGSVEKHNQLVCRHPRGGASRLRANPQDLVNRIVRHFRPQYELARSRASTTTPPVACFAPISDGSVSGDTEHLKEVLVDQRVLPERRLRHPDLPFVGIVDLIWRAPDGTHLVDFKTGAFSESHRFQILCYGVLWWRSTGDIPSRLEIRYPSEVIDVASNKTTLEEGERELRRRIETTAAILAKRPADARLGDWCRFCDVRAFCGSYWESSTGPRPGARRVSATRDGESSEATDIEVTVRQVPDEYGFEAFTRDGRNLAVVCQPRSLSLLGPLAVGDRLRIIGATSRSRGELDLRPWTEVFVVPRRAEEFTEVMPATQERDSAPRRESTD